MLRFFGRFVWLRYLMAGGLNTLISYLIYLGLLYWINYRAAYVLAFILGIFGSYVMLRYFVFMRSGKPHALLKVAATHLLQLFLGFAVVNLWVQWLRQSTWSAPIISVIVCTPVVYLLQRLIFSNDSR